MLYFANSLGAAAGVLASGFVLIAWVGLPGTLRTAGIINLALAAALALLARPASASPPIAVRGDHGTSGTLSANLLLTVALLTGLASFIYEICWIRMLSLVLGASTHSFELMLSTFILGLALGGLAVRRLVDRAAHPERLLGWVQVAMGLLALATLPVYDRTFELMEYLMKGLARTDAGYFFFNLAGQGVSALVMLPATFCAGMTLPLINVARTVNPYLAPAEAQAVWERFSGASCFATLRDFQRRWIMLFAAVGSREYLLMAGMAGHIAAGDPARAMDLWKKYADQIRDAGRPVFRLLRCHAARGERGDNASCAAAFAAYAG